MIKIGSTKACHYQRGGVRLWKKSAL